MTIAAALELIVRSLVSTALSAVEPSDLLHQLVLQSSTEASRLRAQGARSFVHNRHVFRMCFRYGLGGER